MNILVVDDEPLVRQSMRMLLELDGHTIDEAQDGAAALTKIAAGAFDLVFTDYSMPEMRGDELARELRSNNASTPVVMISGFPPTPLPPEVSHFMLKPFSLGAVRKCLTSFAV